MRKLLVLITTLLFSLTLASCVQTNNTSDNSSSSSSSKSSSTSSSATSSSHSSSMTLHDDEATPINNHTWTFDEFKILSLNAEQDDGELDLEINWQNTGHQSASFNDLVKITVKQGGQTLNITEQDDDANDALNQSGDDDVDFNYQLNNTNDPITVKVAPANSDTDAQTVTLNLK